MSKCKCKKTAETLAPRGGVGSLAIPLRRFGIALGNYYAFVIHAAEVVLGGGIALTGQLSAGRQYPSRVGLDQSTPCLQSEASSAHAGSAAPITSNSAAMTTHLQI
jgi:hypothetical protein